ncbi:hypothetical protein RRG08_021846 [Elysia crispata]|uniref:Uncharacterized protein n=1 Tax=Elysia crispata TaxID=231223 RepID=A0AAE1DNY1_9GAST|nr:hypothetical protein RRG08_021846 [Elysia crispata]
MSARHGQSGAHHLQPVYQLQETGCLPAASLPIVRGWLLTCSQFTNCKRLVAYLQPAYHLQEAGCLPAASLPFARGWLRTKLACADLY